MLILFLSDIYKIIMPQISTFYGIIILMNFKIMHLPISMRGTMSIRLLSVSKTEW